jgi:hypothetical protein
VLSAFGEDLHGEHLQHQTLLEVPRVGDNDADNYSPYDMFHRVIHLSQLRSSIAGGCQATTGEGELR